MMVIYIYIYFISFLQFAIYWFANIARNHMKQYWRFKFENQPYLRIRNLLLPKTIVLILPTRLYTLKFNICPMSELPDEQSQSPAVGSSGHCTLVLTMRFPRPHTIWHYGDRCRNESCICCHLLFVFNHTLSLIGRSDENNGERASLDAIRTLSTAIDRARTLWQLSTNAVRERECAWTRYVLRERCQRNESEQSSCSVGGGTLVGGNPESGRLKERERERERERETERETERKKVHAKRKKT